MTAFLKWVTETAEQLAKDDAEAGRDMVSTIQQRVSIGLTQARAAECRHIAGEMRLKGLTQIPMMSQLAMWLTDRSHKLEQLGLRMVTEWPIKDEDETPQKEEARVTLQ